jgi:hypothetical protein
MTKTGTVIMVVMVDGVIMMDGVIEVAAVDGGRVPILASMLDRLTPPTDTMRILLRMGITDTFHTDTTADTRTEDCPGDTPMEGGGWAPINPAAAPNTYTGKGGTRR